MEQLRTTASGGVLKKRCSKNISKIQLQTPALALFYNKVAVWRPATLLKRGSGTGVFL